MVAHIPPVLDATCPRLSADTKITRLSGVLETEIHGEIALMHVDRGSYFALDAIGSNIWRLLASPLAFGDLVDSVAAAYEAPQEVIARDVAAFVTRMAALDLVRIA